MSALLIRADARRLPLADDSVDLICTSPPYWALRSYTDNGTHYAGQIGSEPHWRDWLDAMLEVTAECKRVLKPSGSIWINLDDVYSRPGGGADASPRTLPGAGKGATARRPSPTTSIPEKSRVGLPWRYALGCVDQLGLILRAEVIWSKPNGLPESVTDRVRRSHETWFHLVKSPRYYAAVDEIRKPYSQRSNEQAAIDARAGLHAGTAGRKDIGNGVERLRSTTTLNPLGALPGSVWTIASEPLRVPSELGVDHYAAFPTEWPRRLILGWSPPGICLECGEGRRPVVDRRFDLQPDVTPARNTDHGALDASNGWGSVPRGSNTAAITGYACACTPFTDHPERRRPTVTPGPALSRDRDGTKAARDALGEPRQHGDAWPERRPVREYHLDGWTPPPSRPAVVADPFCGTGTTVMVARALGRVGVGLDLSADYLRLARWRVWESGHAGKALARTNRERQGALTLEGA